MAKGKNFHQMSREELQEAGRKGGIASGIAKREKKAMKDVLSILLLMPLKSGESTDIELVKNLAEIKGKNITVQEAIMLAQIQKAMKGDTRAAEFIRDSSDNRPRFAADIEEQQARIDKLKAETARIKGEDPEADKQDDGFIAALKGEVEDIWDEM